MPAKPVQSAEQSRLVYRRCIRGFTLIELIVGIVVFAIVLTIVTSILMPQALRSLDPIYQVKGTELANSLMNEIIAKRFDEHSVGSGGLRRCDEDIDGDSNYTSTGEIACSVASTFGPGNDPGESDRNDFDDVDDFHNYSGVLNILNRDLQQDYPNYTATVSVVYSVDFTTNPVALATDRSSSKLITIVVTTPNGLALTFSRLRGNY